MTDFLYARPSVVEGIARNVDLFGVLNTYNASQNGNEADQKARLNDVKTLKNDFQAAYKLVINGNQI
ncbi:MAG: hypothetical protein FWD22_01145 [Treponema sp.]|nr:hypothetical protein [Treponema sp.]